MMREYLRVRPSSEPLAPTDVPTVLTSLRKLSRKSDRLLRQLIPGGKGPPTFEFLSISTGATEPVEFYYGVDDQNHLDTLATRLKSIYPSSFDIERVDLDPISELLPTVAYDRETYLDHARAGKLYQDPPTRAPEEDVDTSEGWQWLGADDSAPTVGVRTASANGTVTDTLESPILDADGTIRAKPAVDVTTPRGVEWQAFAARRKDWMTTLQPFSAVFDENDAERDASRGRAPLAPVIEHLTEAPEPVALQVVFRRKGDWARSQHRRAGALAADQDTLLQTLLGVESTRSVPEQTPRNPQADAETETRIQHVRENEPARTFVANVRALTLPVDEQLDAAARELLDTRLDTMCPAFDPVDGPYYEVNGRRLREAGRSLGGGGRRARTVTEHFRTRKVETASSWMPAVTNRPNLRPEFVVNGAELANFVVLPSGSSLSETADRGTRAEQESRHPLPVPEPEVLDAFDRPGMSLGYPIDETGDPLDDALWLPPDLQPLHIARFAKTGGGKTISGITDALTTQETTEGPVFIIDGKGGGMPLNYMRAHAARFGFDDLEENVLHFPIPDVLPGLAPLNIEPRIDAGTPRDQAITELVNHYELYLMMVMDEEAYKDATVSRLIIRALLRVMYDEEFGLEHGDYRQSINYCSQAQLEDTLDDFVDAGPPNVDYGALPQASDERLQARFTRRLQADANTFANIVGGVGTRLDYISDDPYLRRVFDNTEPRFDFREMLDEDSVVLFDLGELSDEPSVIMAGVLLTSLLNAIKDRDPEDIAGNDYVANVVIDEAAAVATADVLNDLLERGREFSVSVELLTQFPKQLELAGDREVFLNLLTNIETKLIGPLSVDDELARALAHEDMDPTAFRNRVRRLPRGEWIAQIPSPEFQTTGPLPFSMESLPIPEGHPESDDPFDEREEDRFQDALASVHDRTAAEYGVGDACELPPSNPPDAVADFVDDGDAGYETVMATMVRQVQLQTGQREANGWVPVERVDNLIRECVAAAADDTTEPPSYTTLTDVREETRFVEVHLSPDSEGVVCRLTEAGEVAAAPSTGEVEAAGGEAHDDALDRIETVLADQGFMVSILEQDRSAKPDARAIHPELEPTFNVEVETTTATKPIKILENLRKAQTEDHMPLFVVESGEGHRSETYWAERIDRVLSHPINTRDNRTRLYNRDEHITFSGGATTDGGTTAVRPATDGSRETVWQVADDEYVLTDPSGTDHTRVADPLDAHTSRFPAVYSYEQATDEYVIHEQGDEHIYESAAAFEREWVPVKRPFLPETDLPVPDNPSDRYAILVLQDNEESNGESAVLYEDGHTCPLEVLLAGTYQPASADADDRDGISDPVVASFAATRLVECEDAAVPVSEVYETFEEWASGHGFPTTSEEWFSRHLRTQLSFDRERQYLDGEVTRCFVGIDLVTSTDETE